MTVVNIRNIPMIPDNLRSTRLPQVPRGIKFNRIELMGEYEVVIDSFKDFSDPNLSENLEKKLNEILNRYKVVDVPQGKEMAIALMKDVLSRKIAHNIIHSKKEAKYEELSHASKSLKPLVFNKLFGIIDLFIRESRPQTPESLTLQLKSFISQFNGQVSVEELIRVNSALKACHHINNKDDKPSKKNGAPELSTVVMPTLPDGLAEVIAEYAKKIEISQSTLLPRPGKRTAHLRVPFTSYTLLKKSIEEIDYANLVQKYGEKIVEVGARMYSLEKDTPYLVNGRALKLTLFDRSFIFVVSLEILKILAAQKFPKSKKIPQAFEVLANQLGLSTYTVEGKGDTKIIFEAANAKHTVPLTYDYSMSSVPKSMPYFLAIAAGFYHQCKIHRQKAVVTQEEPAAP